MNRFAVPAQRSPIMNDRMSLESASRAVHVQTDPRPNLPRSFAGTLASFAPTKLQISSHWTRFVFRLRMVLSMNSAQQAPRSTSSFTTVFFAAPVMRTVARMLFPSTNALTTDARFSLLSLFILIFILDRSRIVNGNSGVLGMSASGLCIFSDVKFVLILDFWRREVV